MEHLGGALRVWDMNPFSIGLGRRDVEQSGLVPSGFQSSAHYDYLSYFNKAAFFLLIVLVYNALTGFQCSIVKGWQHISRVRTVRVYPTMGQNAMLAA